MKKLFLLLASGSIAVSAVAQQRNVRFNEGKLPSNFQTTAATPERAKSHAAKTTAAPNRTYSYYQTFDTVMQDVSSWMSGNALIFMWQDKAFAGFTSGYDTSDLVSAGAILHPQHNSVNDPIYYQGEMKITNSDAYTVNSVTVYGRYDFEPTATQIDTLVLSFVYGDGTAGPTSNGIFRGGRVSGGHYGNWPVVTTWYDTTALNYARINNSQGTPNTYVVKVPLGPSTFGDTNANGIWIKDVSLSSLGTGGLNVPAGKQVGMSYSFKSGKPALVMDTIFYTGGVMKHNMWRPLVKYASTDGTTANVQYAPYDSANFNQGIYKSLPHSDNGWSYIYLPQWAWTSTASSGAWVGQHPIIDWEINCATCGNIPPPSVGVADAELISKVSAYPNPAGDVLNVPFTLATATNVSVTLTNVLGQVVATQEMGKVAAGTAKFNTTTLPSGVYTYSVLANGQRSTGRVAINH